MSRLLAIGFGSYLSGNLPYTNSLGIYTQTLLLQGGTDAGNYFQGAAAPPFLSNSDLVNLLQLLDDFLLHAATENGLLKALCAFFQICREYGLRVHALKTNVFMKEATFCGRIFNENGMRFLPSRFDSLTTMQRPDKDCDLLQFTSALNCMRTSIPNYAETVSPLHNLLESCYKRAGGRTKSKLRHISVDPSWGKEHTASFETTIDESSQTQLSQCFGVCLVRPRRELCVRWQAIEHKDEEAVLCANCVTSYPVPRFKRRTGVFIDFRASDASSAYSASRRETGEASFVLRVEITTAMHAVL
jgi:hypothetical protein